METRTEAGTLKAEARLLERATVAPPGGAVLEMVTLQVVEVEAARLVLPHWSEVMEIGAVGALIENATDTLEAPITAVTLAF